MLRRGLPLLFLLALAAAGCGSDETSSAPSGASVVVSSPWPNLGHDIRHSGRGSSPIPDGATQVWKSPDYAHFFAYNHAPVVSGDGTVYISFGRFLVAVTPSGETKWQKEVGNYAGGPALSNTRIYVSARDGTDRSAIIAFDPDGQERWRYQTKNRIDSSKSVIVDTDGVIYAGDEKALYALKPDGTLKWRFTTAGGVSTPAIDSTRGVVYVSVQPDSWSRGRPCGTVVVGVSGGCWVYGITQNGRLKFLEQFGDRLGAPSVAADGSVIVTSRDRYVYALDPSGSEKWRSRLDSEGTSWHGPAQGVDGSVYVTDTGAVYALDPANGNRRWRVPAHGANGPVIDTNGNLYLTTSGGVLSLGGGGNERWRVNLSYYVGSAPGAIAKERLFVVGRTNDKRSGYDGKDAALFAFGAK